VLVSMPECFVEVLVIGEGTAEALAVSVDVERTELSCGKLDGRPFESNGGLRNIADLERTDRTRSGFHVCKATH